ncbi:MAG: monomethylamine:corrinoid methyltransferase [Chloroflexi bacterium]|nr:monomethylamine:corrinoid methyltransferase [Chloroflexota bacterium]
MIPFKGFVSRSMGGPVMTEQEFDLKLSRRLRSLTADYGVHFQPAEIICDDATADAIFQAAMELIGEVGIYNVDTNRVILLTSQELEETCRQTPRHFVRGAGRDAVTVAARSHNSRLVPYVFRWPLWHPRSLTSEAFLAEMMEAHLPEKTELGDLARELKPRLEGVENKAGTVGDTMWAIAVARWCLTVARMVGRPDMFLGAVSAITAPAILACFAGDNLYKKHHSSFSVTTMPELKINWEHLQLAFIAREMGVARRIGGVTVLGGYARNAEETAILSAATLLAQLSYSAGDWAHVAPVDREGQRSGRATMQAQSGACRAAERNIEIATTMLQHTANGLGSAFSLYEKAALVTEQTCSGTSSFWKFPCHPGRDGEPKTDLDCEFVARVARAVSGMEREHANELVNKILALYEGSLDRPVKGKPYSYYYDLRTLAPLRELVDMHRKAEEDLARLGVPLPRTACRDTPCGGRNTGGQPGTTGASPVATGQEARAAVNDKEEQ